MDDEETHLRWALKKTKKNNRDMKRKWDRKKRTSDSVRKASHFFSLLDSDELLRPWWEEVNQFKWKISSKTAIQRVVMDILVMLWESGTRRLNRSVVCWELSHSFAVVLWGGDLVVSGTEEGWWILYQVPAGQEELPVSEEGHGSCSLSRSA